MIRARELAGLVAVLGTAACVVTTNPPPPRAVVVTGPPPAPLADSQPPPPDARAVWVPGYWHWTGMQYAWIPGRWEAAPPGARWYGPRYGRQGGSFFYQPGGWNGSGTPR